MKTFKVKLNGIVLFIVIAICISGTNKLLAQNTADPIITKDSEILKIVPFYEKRDYSKAKTMLQEIIAKNAKNADAHYALSNVYARLNNTDDAVEAVEKAIELNKNNAEYHYTLGRIHLIELRNASIFRMPSLSSSVKEELLTTIKLNPKHKLAIITLGNYYFQAPSIAGGDVDKALEQANNLLKLDEKEGHRLLCLIYTSQSNYSKAIEEANTLTKTDEYSGRILLIQIYKKQGDISKTEKEYISIESKYGDNPKYFAFFNDYGYFLLNLKRVDEAIDKFKKQVKLAPNSSNAHDSLGEGYYLKGMIKESLAEYNKALELDPNSQNAKDKIKEIKGKYGM